jgi:hypothetical protein
LLSGADIARSYGYDGTNIGVAIIDSGITLNNDLKDSLYKSRIVYANSLWQLTENLFCTHHAAAAAQIRACGADIVSQVVSGLVAKCPLGAWSYPRGLTVFRDLRLVSHMQ